MKTADTFSARLRAAIDASGRTITDVARESGLARQTVTQYLTGTREPTFEAACKLADALEIDVGELRSAASAR